MADITLRSSFVSALIIIIINHEASILSGLSGSLSPEHTKARACAEGQKERALWDEEASEHVTIVLPGVAIWVVYFFDQAACLSSISETVNTCQDNSDEVGDLGELHAREDNLEQLAVDQSSETAHDQSTQHCVDDSIEVEDNSPVGVIFLTN